MILTLTAVNVMGTASNESRKKAAFPHKHSNSTSSTRHASHNVVPPRRLPSLIDKTQGSFQRGPMVNVAAAVTVRWCGHARKTSASNHSSWHFSVRDIDSESSEFRPGMRETSIMHQLLATHSAWLDCGLVFEGSHEADQASQCRAKAAASAAWSQARAEESDGRFGCAAR